MSLPVNPTPVPSQQVGPTNPVQPRSPSASTTEAMASVHGGAELNSNSKISSLDDLRKKSPKLYNMMMVGIATKICNEMENHQKEMKKLRQEYERRV